jgi:hypothetical protein
VLLTTDGPRLRQNSLQTPLVQVECRDGRRDSLGRDAQAVLTSDTVDKGSVHLPADDDDTCILDRLESRIPPVNRDHIDIFGPIT